MAAVTKATIGLGGPSISTAVPPDSSRLPPAQIGEDIAAGDACTIRSDGKIYRSLGNGVLGTTAEVDGFALQAAKASQRQALSLYHDVNLNYGTGMTPGTFLYLSNSVPGGLDTVVPSVQLKPVARVMPDGKRIRVTRTY